MSEFAPESVQVESAIAGDSAALEHLLWSHYGTLERHIAPKISAAARKHFGVEDILQTVFSQAFRDIRKFEPRGDGAFFAWLRTIADHRLIDELRKLDRGGAHQVSNTAFGSENSIRELFDVVCRDSDSPSKAAAGKEAIQAMRIAIAGLPEDQQQVIRLHFLEHKTIEEIAAKTGRTEAAIRGLVHRGKKNLAEAMGRSSRWFSSG